MPIRTSSHSPAIGSGTNAGSVTRWPLIVTPPAVIVRRALEAAPLVICDWLDDRDDVRRSDWFDTHPEYQELIAHAIDLAERERAA